MCEAPARVVRMLRTTRVEALCLCNLIQIDH